MQPKCYVWFCRHLYHILDKLIYDSLDLSMTSAHSIVGVDIGYNDSDAIAVIEFNRHHKKVYLVDEHVKNKQNIIFV